MAEEILIGSAIKGVAQSKMGEELGRGVGQGIGNLTNVEGAISGKTMTTALKGTEELGKAGLSTTGEIFKEYITAFSPVNIINAIKGPPKQVYARDNEGKIYRVSGGGHLGDNINWIYIIIIFAMILLICVIDNKISMNVLLLSLMVVISSLIYMNYKKSYIRNN